MDGCNNKTEIAIAAKQAYLAYAQKTGFTDVMLKAYIETGKVPENTELSIVQSMQALHDALFTNIGIRYAHVPSSDEVSSKEHRHATFMKVIITELFADHVTKETIKVSEAMENWQAQP